MRQVSQCSFSRSAVVLVAFGAAALLARADTANWPTWRGPEMTGRAADAGLPVTFGETNNLRWKVATPGQGTSTPVIWGDRLFLLTADRVPAKAPATNAPGPGPRGISAPSGAYRFKVVCLDRHTGRTLWQKTVREEVPHEGHHPDHGFASASPVTDGHTVWAFFGSRGLHCLTMDGELRWSRDLGQLRTRNSFGEGSSPALAGKAIIVVLDQEGASSIAAIDKETGAVLWRQPREEATSWTTPLPVRHGGKLQVVVSGTRRTRSYAPETGQVLWQCGGQTTNVIPTPVTGFGLVFCTSGFRGSALQAIDLGRTGELTGTDAVRWEFPRATPYVPSPLLYGRRLYFFEGTQPLLTCLDAETGRAHYTAQRIAGMNSVYASPVGLDGRLYLAGRDGCVAVVKDSDTFELLALNKLDDGFDASPAVAGRDLYLRGKNFVYCIHGDQ